MQPKKLAVLIDAENVPAKHAPKLFASLAGLGRLSIVRAYADFTEVNRKAWAEQVSAFAIEPRQVFATPLGKNSADILMTIDAMDILHAGEVDGFCLASSDRDFTRLAMRIRESGLTVHGLGNSNASQTLQAACDQFFVLSDPVSELKSVATGKAGSKTKTCSQSEFATAVETALDTLQKSEKGSYSVTELGKHLAEMGCSYSGTLSRNLEATDLFEMTKNKQKFRWKPVPPAAIKPPAQKACRSAS